MASAFERPPGENGRRSVREWFDTLLDVPAPERAARLQQLDLEPVECEQLRRMLEADAQSRCVVDRPVGETIDKLSAGLIPASRLIGTTVGSFRLCELLGEGGTAAVFRAERAAGSGSQFVALKLLRTGLYSANAERRFLREVGILAQLRHPDIAGLVESGVGDNGTPYIAMELAEGLPITEAADAVALKPAERLKLFVRLCRAVGAAHGSLIVHRDIKPSNILVDAQGRLAVLDFGIARLMTPEAGSEPTQSISLTPEYAAPEQFTPCHQTTAVDVFALGVILGELLTGQRLREQPLSSAVAHGGTVPTGLPDARSLARLLRGDLDAIALNATAADPARRYPSAEALANDVERFLEGRPVAARRATSLYLVRKYIGRHRFALALVASVLVAVSSSAGFAWRQMQLARQETARATSMHEFTLGVLEAIQANAAAGAQNNRESIVTLVADHLDRARDLAPEVRADLDRRLGRMFESAYGAPLKIPQDPAQAQRLALDDAAPPSRERFEALDWYAFRLRETSAAPWLDSQPYLEQALQVASALFPADSYEVRSLRSKTAQNLASLWQVDRALPLAQALVDSLDGVLAPANPVRTAETINLMRLRALSEDRAGVEGWFRGLLAAHEQEWSGPDRLRRRHAALFDLSEVLRFEGNYVEADRFLADALQALEIFDPDHTQHWANDRAHALEFFLDRGDLEKAEPLARSLWAWADAYRGRLPAEHVLPALAQFEVRRGNASAALEARLLRAPA